MSVEKTRSENAALSALMTATRQGQPQAEIDRLKLQHRIAVARRKVAVAEAELSEALAAAEVSEP